MSRACQVGGLCNAKPHSPVVLVPPPNPAATLTELGDCGAFNRFDIHFQPAYHDLASI